MDDSDGRAQRDWTANDETVLLRLPRIVDAPGFEAAMAAMARNMLDVSDADPALAAIFKDAGRYVGALCAAALQDEGVTLNRLRVLAEGFGLVSSGRVYALLQYLRYLGFVELWSKRSAAGQVHYTVSADFLARWRSHLGAALTAAGQIDPAAAAAAQRLDDADFMARFCAAQMATLRAFAQQSDTTSPLFSVFLNRHAGSQILWSLLANDPGTCPPAAPFPIVPGELAVRFNVSRMHVSRLLKDARKLGLLVPHDDDRFQFTPAARDDLRTFYAWQLGLLIVAAARAQAGAKVATDQTVAA